MAGNKRNYRLEKAPYAEGGQAEVFKAEDRETGNVVAFKRVLSRYEEDDIARMKREIEVQSSISHPNIMPVLDYSRRYQWYVMPFAKMSLESCDCPIDNQEILELVNSIASGLRVAHADGYIHRDIKPSNVLKITVGSNLEWVLSDWGLVRKKGKTTKKRTISGQIYGSEGFAAPEMSISAHDANTYTDVYSIGRLVYWCLTGQVPPQNIQVPVEGIWRNFIRKTTENKISNRIQDVDGVLQSLKEVKNLIELIDSDIAFPFVAYDGACPRCKSKEYTVKGMEDGRATYICECLVCGYPFRYIRYDY
ncbi:MAG: serine/threonine protein kinase [Dehalococcoidales bacterium]|nr:serine/threonine protein kinase [Dehalococcoidales bacterium]